LDAFLSSFHQREEKPMGSEEDQGNQDKSGNSGESRGPRVGLFVDLFTDAGFKYAFGRPKSKQSLIHFLNTLLDKINIRIRDIEYQNTEQLAEIALGRHSIFDIYCITDEGDHIIIEMQSQYQPNYVERGLFYIAIPLRKQGQKGEWNFELKRVLMINVLSDHMRPQMKLSDDVVSVAGLYLKDSSKLLTDKLAILFVETYNSSKTLEELKTAEDLWLYLLKNMGSMDEVPERYRVAPFIDLFEQARVANMNWDEYEAYLAKYKDRWEANAIRKGILEEGIQKGIQKGEAKKLNEFVLRLAAMDYKPEEIVKLTGASLDDVKHILNKREERT